LLGEAVRYDKRDKHQPVLDALAEQWALLPFCPELAAGLGVPRPAMDLVGPPGAVRVLDRAAGVDLTAPIHAAVAAFVTASAPIDGAILKAGSPSCGVESARRYAQIDDAAPVERVDGLLAAALRGLDPAPALIDEAALADAAARARFAVAVELRRWWRLDRAELVAALRAWAASRAARGEITQKIDIAENTPSADHDLLVGHIDAMLSRTALDDLPPRLHAAATGVAAVHLTIGSRIAAPRRDRTVPLRRETKAGSP
jgi:uncharacterized protein YbbK (DUF523 family)